MEPSLLLASLLALGVGPVAHHVLEGRTRYLFHGALVAALLALLCLHVLPECVAAAGWWSLGVAGLGLLAPLAAERGAGRLGARSGRLAAGAVVVGLLVHAFLDGVGIAGGGGDAHAHAGHDHAPHALGLAVVLHRIPVGGALWWILKPGRGVGPALAALGAIGVATIAGYAVGAELVPHLDAAPLALGQAFIGGVLLHVVAHRPRPASI
ncbi:MAG: hypothetical protein ACFCGT_05080 [Sandaracinaceae bacterium]